MDCFFTIVRMDPMTGRRMDLGDAFETSTEANLRLEEINRSDPKGRYFVKLVPGARREASLA